ncbi:hypothetical protein [Enterobacter soli]|uniref:hypothetical protein n=1 Tax=Enterobacter soli TaxID=885040 RepID=UPI002F3EA0E0
MNDYIKKGEQVYKEFIEFRDSFLNKALAEAATYGTNMYGQKFRPVVIVPERQATRWQEMIQQWNDYADELRKYPELNIPKSLYEPAPKFIMGANRIRANVVPAVNAMKVTREKVIKEIQNMIDRVKGSEDTKEFISSLNHQIELVSALPEKTQLRVRRGGYEDLICTYNTATEKKLMERVTAHGIFFDDRVLRYGFSLGSNYETARTSVYDFVDPLPLTIYKNAKVYVISDIEKAQLALKNERQTNEEQRKRDYWARANEKRRAKLRKEKALTDGAQNAAGEQNPAGNNDE